MSNERWTHKFVSIRRADSVAKEFGRQRGYVRVTAGLLKLEGNARPCFSVTADVYSPGHTDNPFACGCQHDVVLRLWPRLAPVVALHLCDDNGMPMHAEANGWYQLAGYYGGAGETYHAGTAKRNFDVPAPADKPWMNYEHRVPTPAECLAQWAEHVRVSVTEAYRLAEAWRPVVIDDMSGMTNQTWVGVRAIVAAWLNTQRERWQREADDACLLLDTMKARQSQEMSE